MDLTKLQQRFDNHFAGPPAGAVRAPGRVNLIGEHTDYNDGFVLPIAIERQTLALYARRDGRQVRVRSLQQDAPAAIDLDAPVEPGEPKWANYVRGVAAGLLARGVKLVGCDILFASDVPLGGGLSSSASLEVAAAMALLAAAGRPRKVKGRDLALLCQEAEHKFANSPCGIMDQSIAAQARAGKAMLLDCRSGETKHVPFDDASKTLLVADTQVKHAIGGGEYAERRRQCEAAAAKLGVASLRDATERQVAEAAREGKLLDKELARARHVVGEIARTLQAVEALRTGDSLMFGELMYASQESLRDDYEVSCAELDAIVQIAEGCDGVHGARMTGGGFGGCAILLTDADAADAAAEAIAASFEKRFGRRCPVFATRAAGGAGPIGLA